MYCVNKQFLEGKTRLFDKDGREEDVFLSRLGLYGKQVKVRIDIQGNRQG
jgi:hypothetical protein